MSVSSFIEVGNTQFCKHSQNIAGDVFLSRKCQHGSQVISVLADGLGSGAEACSLASLTAQMAMEYVAGNISTPKAARIVMDALPLCAVRKISYSTFTIVDTNLQGVTRIIEHGNPSYVLLHDGECMRPKSEVISEPRWNGRYLSYTEFNATFGDRIVIMSDGVTQSGMGTPTYPLGWGDDQVCRYLCELVKQQPHISARSLCQLLAERAAQNDGWRAGDDITCGIVYFRKPRRTLVLTGPPYEKHTDVQIARMADTYDGRRVVCGGTTANILARELNREITMDIMDIDPEIPTTSDMDGFDLVTEGCLTLSKTAELLQNAQKPTRTNGASKLVEMLLQSDIIEFVVGTRINEAHQNPNLPIELDIRRNVVKKIAALLEHQYLKEVHIDYV